MDLGPKWDIGFTSDWQISGGKAKGIAGDAIHVQRFPDKDGSMMIAVDVHDTQYGDVYAALLAWYDEDNYLYVKFIAPEDEYADQYWETVLGEVVDGIATEVSDTPQLNPDCEGLDYRVFEEGGAHSCLVAYDGDALYTSGVDAGNPSEVFTRCVGPRTKTPANRAGLAHGGGVNPIWVLRFWASEHYRTNPECPDMGCNCGYNCLGDQLVLTADIIVGDCSQQITFPIETHLYKFKKNEAIWRTDSILHCGSWSGFDPVAHRFWLFCASTSGRTADYLLGITFNDNACPDEGEARRQWIENAVSETRVVSIQCDPLELVYDVPYLMWWPCCFEPGSEVPPPEPLPPEVVMRVWITENVPA